ncbi:uncharacterized protein LOC129753850 [Uranotaenia lowii]|uniref:uncharacterized protein LOC129753850 n=1 Tax=Uranotaenia lowii TaxID=190385 RepID=UPI0024791064|nr:uncharacterized protein LOC129753850 [Uranotaenia lowii]
MGDFNINVAAEQPSSSLVALNRIHTAFNLFILPTAPTRITEHSSTTIDLLVTDTPQSIKKAKTSSANTLSDHEIVFLIADLRIPEPPPQLITVRNLRSIDQARLHVDFQNRDFSQFYNTPNVDTKTQLLTAELKSLLDTHAPERTTIVRDRKTPWITFEIKRAIAVRDLAYSLYVRNPNRFKGDAQWVEYIRERSRANSLISNAKKRYAERCFSNDISPKQLWSNLRREGVHNNSKRSSPDEGFDIDLLNAFFSDGHQTNRPGPTPAPDVITEPTRTTRRFSFHQITTNEVSNKLFEIQSNAIGCDNIPVSFLKLLCPFILPVMKHLFNTIISSNHFPSCWKKAIVTPIPKVTSPTSAKDFRPISVLPAISKVLEKILLSQITLHLNESDPPLLAMNQSGYRKGYSTTTALTKVVHDMTTVVDQLR